VRRGSRSLALAVFHGAGIESRGLVGVGSEILLEVAILFAGIQLVCHRHTFFGAQSLRRALQNFITFWAASAARRCR